MCEWCEDGALFFSGDCKYCAEVDGDTLCFFGIGGEDCLLMRKIHYCPMCGRDLKGEGK